MKFSYKKKKVENRSLRRWCDGRDACVDLSFLLTFLQGGLELGSELTQEIVWSKQFHSLRHRLHKRPTYIFLFHSEKKILYDMER